MKIFAVTIAGTVLLSTGAGCGAGDGTEPLPDSTSSENGGTLRSSAEEILQPREAPSGARSLIDDSHSAAEQANARTEALEEMMGDM
ncbi:MAG: hypothetical protein R6U39_04060 [Candidatus Aegiribacteria sp.]